MQQRFTFSLASAAVLVSGYLATGPALAQMELKFGHVGAPGSLFEFSANEFAACANDRLGDVAEVQTFGSSQLGTDQELLQKLKLGQVQFALPSSVMSSVAEEFGIFEMPYIIQDREHMKRVQEAILESTLQPAVQAKGYRIIGVWENGFRHITNNVRPINTPEDLQGIKLRTPKGAWRVKMFQLYGANPTPMAFSEVFTALQTGVIDGQENPYAQIASAKFQEVQDYLSITGHVYTPAYLLVSDQHFSELPDDVQVVLTECGQETQAAVYEKAAQLEEELLQVIKDAGVEVNEADKQAFIEASGPIYEEFATSLEGGGELIEQVQSLAQGS
jgi:tripartite ATP-independent transporter DctP family solute receptor